MIYQAMFDEVDEGTAIFKCTDDPPVGETHFLDFEGLPSDFYLKMVGKASGLMREGKTLVTADGTAVNDSANQPDPIYETGQPTDVFFAAQAFGAALCRDAILSFDELGADRAPPTEPNPASSMARSPGTI